MATWLRQDPTNTGIIPTRYQAGARGGGTARARCADVWLPQPISAVVASLQRLAADLDRWDRAEPETSVALNDAVHAIQRAIVAAQELDAAADKPSFAEQWIG